MKRLMFDIFLNFGLRALAQQQGNFLALESPAWLQQLLSEVGLQFYIVFGGEEAEVQNGVLAISRCGTLALYSGIFLSLGRSENTRE